MGYELFLRWETAEVRAVFTQHYLYGFHPDRVNAGQIYAAHAEQRLSHGLFPAFLHVFGLLRIPYWRRRLLTKFLPLHEGAGLFPPACSRRPGGRIIGLYYGPVLVYRANLLLVACCSQQGTRPMARPNRTRPSKFGSAPPSSKLRRPTSG